MSVNREKPYLIVLFEDNAYKDLFMGFQFSTQRQVKQNTVYGGFKYIYLELTNNDSLTLKELKKYSNAYVLAMIDADLDSQSESNIEKLKSSICTEYKERVFVVGSQYEAEDIKKTVIEQGKWKSVSKKLENSCINEDCGLWQDEMLEHNSAEIARLKKIFDWEQFYE